MDDRLLALLDLPKGSSINLDGHPIILQRDDFVGFYNLPRNQLHFVSIRSCDTNQESNSGIQKLTVGFIILDGALPFIRRYDKWTEEVSSKPLDNLTTTNLLCTIREEEHETALRAQCLIDYNKLLVGNESENWKQFTAFITNNLLEKRKLCSGDKIVPGSFDEVPVDNSSDNHTSYSVVPATEGTKDGKQIDYPDIPVINRLISYNNDGTGPMRYKYSRHIGTKRFITKLSPSQRTKIFTQHDNPSITVLNIVLSNSYDNDWNLLLGDIQLSYCLFLNLNCYSSFCHWRDLVAMLSSSAGAVVASWNVANATACATATEEKQHHIEFYSKLISVITLQITHMEPDFLEGDEAADNFLIPAVQHLFKSLGKISPSYTQLATALSTLRRVLSNLFPVHFGNALSGSGNTTDNDVFAATNEDRIECSDDDCENYDEDGPVIVAGNEIEASLLRSSDNYFNNSVRKIIKFPGTNQYSSAIRHQYPLLFAAMLPCEDIVMTCARALDDKTDVSLVREAAAYLEQVEVNTNI